MTTSAAAELATVEGQSRLYEAEYPSNRVPVADQSGAWPLQDCSLQSSCSS